MGPMLDFSCPWLVMTLPLLLSMCQFLLVYIHHQLSNASWLCSCCCQCTTVHSIHYSYASSLCKFQRLSCGPKHYWYLDEATKLSWLTYELFGLRVTWAGRVLAIKSWLTCLWDPSKTGLHMNVIVGLCYTWMSFVLHMDSIVVDHSGLLLNYVVGQSRA